MKANPSFVTSLLGVATAAALTYRHYIRKKEFARGIKPLSEPCTKDNLVILSNGAATSDRERAVYDTLIEAAVASTSNSLVVLLPQGKNATCYILELYNHIYDRACAYGNPSLDIRIITTTSTNLEVLNDEASHSFNQIFHNDNNMNVTNRYTYVPVTFPKCIFFDENQNKMYESVVLGGSFDHFHAGHKKLITAAASICTKTLIVGIMSGCQLKRKQFASVIQPQEKRLRLVQEFIAKCFPSLNAVVTIMIDPFGPSIEIQKIDAIVVSTETIGGAVMVNQKRKLRGLNECEIHVIRRTDVTTLSSSYLRSLEY